jgi:hypothetical protein
MGIEAKIKAFTEGNKEYSSSTDAEIKTLSKEITALHGEIKAGVEAKEFEIGELEGIEAFTDIASGVKVRMDKIVAVQTELAAKNAAAEEALKAFDATVQASEEVEVPEVDAKADESDEKADEDEDSKEDEADEKAEDTKEETETPEVEVETKQASVTVKENKSFTPKSKKAVTETSGEVFATAGIPDSNNFKEFSDKKELKKFVTKTFLDRMQRFNGNVKTSVEGSQLVSIQSAAPEFAPKSLDEFRDGFKNLVADKAQFNADVIKAGTGACGLPEISYNINVLGCADTPVEDSFTVVRGDGRAWQFYAEQEFADYSADYEAGTASHTSAEDIAGTNYPKVCVVETCSDSAICEIEARHYCVKHSNWTLMTAPEQYEAALERAANSWARIGERELMQKVHDRANADGHKLGLLPYLVGQSAVDSFVSTISNLVGRLRARGRFCNSQGYTLYAPETVKNVLAEDLARRFGFTSGPSVNEVFSRLSSAYNISTVFYVDQFGETALSNTTTSGDPTMPTADVTGSAFVLPRQYRFALIRDGSVVLRDAGTINLGVTRTQADIANNMFGMFEEDFKNLCFLSNGTYLFDIDLCPNGVEAPRGTAIACA